MRRIYTAREAGSCEYIFGSFVKNGAGDRNVIREGSERVSDGLCYCPACPFCVERTRLIALSCFPPPPFLFLLLWHLVMLHPT